MNLQSFNMEKIPAEIIKTMGAGFENTSLPKEVTRTLAGVSRPLKSKKIKCLCKFCKISFWIIPSEIKKGRKFCSRMCFYKWNRGKNSFRYKKIKRICEVCKKEFLVIPATIKKHGGKYCSNKCKGISYTGREAPWAKKKHSLATRKKMSERGKGKNNANYGNYHSSSIRICKVCNKKFRVRNSRIKKGEGLYCSKKCEGIGKRGLYAGKNSPNWKGGVTPVNELIRKSTKYLEWRKSIFERDNYTCQNCNAHSGNGKAIYLEAHHIKSFAKYPELRFDVNNGITLCFDCHNLTKEGKERRRAKCQK